MIKKFFILFLLPAIVFISCQKGDETFDYKIEGLTDLKLTPGQTEMIELSIEKIQGPAEPVSLKLIDVPHGITSAIETEAGTPDSHFSTTMAIIISKQIEIGSYSFKLEVTSASQTKILTFNIEIFDRLSMVMMVYDATQWTTERPTGEWATDATINLYTSEAALLAKTPVYTAITGKTGKANFYHLKPGLYLFTVEKGDLSNIVEKTLINGTMKGFVTASIFQTRNEVYNSAQPTAQVGQLKYHDLNVDGKITDADRSLYDKIVIYEGELSENVIWIGP